MTFGEIISFSVGVTLTVIAFVTVTVIAFVTVTVIIFDRSFLVAPDLVIPFSYLIVSFNDVKNPGRS